MGFRCESDGKVFVTIIFPVTWAIGLSGQQANRPSPGPIATRNGLHWPARRSAVRRATADHSHGDTEKADPHTLRAEPRPGGGAV